MLWRSGVRSYVCLSSEQSRAEWWPSAESVAPDVKPLRSQNHFSLDEIGVIGFFARVSFSYSASTNDFKLARLALQKLRYCSSQESTALSGSGLSWYKRFRPSLRSSTRWARRRILRCLEIAGRDTGKARAISPAGRIPARNKSSTARRVGSARALKAASREYVTARRRIICNRTVTRCACQEFFGSSSREWEYRLRLIKVGSARRSRRPPFENRKGWGGLLNYRSVNAVQTSASSSSSNCLL